MAKFYVTYGFGSAQRNNYSVVEADSYAAAREFIFKSIGDAWAFLYDERSKVMAIDDFELTEIPLQPQTPRADEPQPFTREP